MISLLLGAAIGALMMIAIGAARSESQSPGRFQLVAADGHVLKIDTATGQVWKSITAKDDDDFGKPVLGK